MASTEAGRGVLLELDPKVGNMVDLAYTHDLVLIPAAAYNRSVSERLCAPRAKHSQEASAYRQLVRCALNSASVPNAPRAQATEESPR